MTAPRTAIAGLGRFISRGPLPDACELCGAELSGAHRHVVDLESRTLRCACQPCSLLFSQPGAGGGRLRTAGDRVLVDPGLALTRQVWAEHTGIPVQLAFVFWSSAIDRWVATFPSPAGPTEAELEPSAYERLASLSPLFSEAEPDTEAILVRATIGAAELACYLVPVDVCYRLAGEIRARWSGFSGGDAAHQAIDDLFAELDRRSRPIAAEGQ